MDLIYISHENNLVRLEMLDKMQIASKKKEKSNETIAAEIWMIGIMFLKLAKHLSKHKNINMFKVLQIVSNGDSVEELPLSKNAWDLVKKMLSKKPKERISPANSLDHEWFLEGKS